MVAFTLQTDLVQYRHLISLRLQQVSCAALIYESIEGYDTLSIPSY